MLNKKIAEIFREIADMLELEDEKRVFEVRAYRNAALTIETMQEDIEGIYRKGGIKALMELQGIGKTTAGHIEEYIKSGKIKKYEEYKKKYPIDFSSLMRIQGLGPKRAYRLYAELGVNDVASLKAAIAAGKVRNLSGFGKRSEEVLQKGISLLESSKGRLLLGDALPEAEAIIRQLKNSGYAERVELAGSARRMKETVGDIDILVISSKPDKMANFISKMEDAASVTLSGPTKTTVWLKAGISCDIRVLERKSFGAAMQYFIGSKEHNVKLRQIAIKKGYKLSEYGLFDRRGRSVAGEEEKEIYEKLGMQYMEPEMREDKGEIEQALKHEIHRLVQREDIRGDLHSHTIYTDGHESIESMAMAAITEGFEYLGMTDHSKSEYVTGGMDERKIDAYYREIEAVGKKLGDRIMLLKSAETDILKDGSLDLGYKTLEKMDYVLGAIHSNLNMGEQEMTKRLVSCIESGKVNIIAHPTGRLIGRREPIKLNLDKVFQAAKDNGVVMEIDSFPDRLDLNDENILKAREYGLKFSIDTDSHSASNFKFIRYGIGTAKRGWLRKEDVINTLPYEKLMKIFRR